MAIKRIGEGDRERRPANFKEVGGQARRHALKTNTSTEVKPLGKKKLTLAKPAKSTKAEDNGGWYPSEDDPVPEPGGHPSALAKTAALNGRRLPSSKSGIADSYEKAKSSNDEDDNVDSESLDPFLDALAPKAPPKPRSPRTQKQDDELVERGRRGLPMLRPAPVKELYAESPEMAAETGMPMEPPSPVAYIPEKLRRTHYTDQQERNVAAMSVALPGVICNQCPASETCDQFQDNATCAFENDFSALSSRDAGNTLPLLELFADTQVKRAMRGVMIEARVAGGQIDPNVTRQIVAASDAVERVARLKVPMQQANTRTVTVTSQDAGVAKGGGILSQLLSGFMPAQTESVVKGELEAPGGDIVLTPPPEQTEEAMFARSSTVTTTETSTPILPLKDGQ